MFTVAQGDSSSVPNVTLQPGKDYWLTLSLPVSLPTWVTTQIYNALALVHVNVYSVQNPPNQLIIHFKT